METHKHAAIACVLAMLRAHADIVADCLNPSLVRDDDPEPPWHEYRGLAFDLDPEQAVVAEADDV